MFVVTNICYDKSFVATKICLLWQTRVCWDKNDTCSSTRQQWCKNCAVWTKSPPPLELLQYLMSTTVTRTSLASLGQSILNTTTVQFTLWQQAWCPQPAQLKLIWSSSPTSLSTAWHVMCIYTSVSVSAFFFTDVSFQTPPLPCLKSFWLDFHIIIRVLINTDITVT